MSPRPAFRHGAARTSLRAACALIASGVFLGFSLGVPAQASVDPESPAPDSPALLEIAPSDPVVRAETTEIEFTLRLVNLGETPLPGGTVTLRLDGAPLSELDGDTAEVSASSSQIAESTLPSLDVLAETERTITVQAENWSSTERTGVHRVQATFVPETDASDPAPDLDLGLDDSTNPADTTDISGSPELIATTQLIWPGDSTAVLPVSFIVPLVMPDEVRTLPTRRQLEAAVPTWTTLLEQARIARATLAIDPRVYAGIRAYGDNAPAAARTFLAKLEASTLPQVVLQFADADPAAQASLGSTELLAAPNLDFVTRFGGFAPSEAAENSVDDTDESDAGSTGTPEDLNAADPNPGAGPPPSREELLEWATPTTSAWPVAGEVDAATLQLLGSNQITSVVLSSSNTTLLGGPRATLSAGTSGVSEATVTDAGMDAAAARMLNGDSATARAAGTADLAARIFLAAEQGSPGVIIGLDRGAIGAADAGDQGNQVEALLTTVSGYTWARAIPIAEQTEGTAALISGSTLETRLELLRSALNREPAIDELGSLLVHPEYLTGYQRARLLELFATRHATDDFGAVAQSFRERDAQLLSGVQAISTASTQLVGTSTRVPVQLFNALPFDAIVTVEASPASAAVGLPESVFPDILVPSEANERVLIPVQARVSSGESGIVVSVSSVNTDLTVFTGTLPLSIRASFELIAIWSMSILAALLLGFGIWRSVRRRRKLSAKRSAPQE